MAPSALARMCAAVVLGALAVLALPQASAAGLPRGPDLTVASLSPPAEAPLGGSFRLSFRLRNLGASPARRPSTAFYLSPDRRADRHDYRVGHASVRDVAGGRTAKGSARVRTPRGLPQTSLFLLACADDPGRIRERNERNNCRTASRPVRLTGGSSFALIDSAVRTRKLSAEQGAIFKVFTLFGDPRLPRAYRGDRSRPPDAFMSVVARALPRLSPRARSTLAPFLRPPSYPGSFADPRARRASARTSGAGGGPEGCPPRGENWRSVPTANGKARVWWDAATPGLAEQAASLAAEIDRTIWPKFVASGMREPLSDEGVGCFNGGDGRLDVYLLTAASFGKLSGLGVAVPYPGFERTCRSPKFLAIELGAHNVLSTAAHEIFHAFQGAYDSRTTCFEGDHWWTEATAAWAEELAYPEQTFGHRYPELLEARSAPMPNDAGYASWVFPYYLSQRFGPSLIPRIWERTESTNVFDAIDGGIPGRMSERWPDFALHAWNQNPIPLDPVQASFAQWDRFSARPSGRPWSFRLGGRRMARDFFVPILPKAPSKAYEVLDFPDPKVRHIKLDNPAFGGKQPGLRLRALIQLADGGWRHEDWTDRPTPSFCRDRPAGDVRRLVLVYAVSGPPGHEVRGTRALDLKDECEYPYYFDVVSVEGRYDASGTTARAYPDGCDEKWEVHWRASGGPAPRAGGLGVKSRDAQGRPVFAIGLGALFDLVLESGTSQEVNCEEPETCTAKPGSYGQTRVSLSEDPANATGNKLPVFWRFGYPQAHADQGCAVGPFLEGVEADTREQNRHLSYRELSLDSFEGDTVTVPYRATESFNDGEGNTHTKTVDFTIRLKRIPPPRTAR